MNKKTQRQGDSSVPNRDLSSAENELGDQEAAGVAVGRRVTRLRAKQKLSQRELDALADFGHGWVSALEAGHIKNPGIDSLFRLAAAFGVPVTRLLVDDPGEGASRSGAVYAYGDLSSGEHEQSEELQELQLLYSAIHAIWERDPGRIAALLVIVQDMQHQAQIESKLPRRKAPAAR